MDKKRSIIAITFAWMEITVGIIGLGSSVYFLNILFDIYTKRDGSAAIAFVAYLALTVISLFASLFLVPGIGILRKKRWTKFVNIFLLFIICGVALFISILHIRQNRVDQLRQNFKSIGADELGDIKNELSTHQKSWETLLLAMKNGNVEGIKQVVTEKGFASLIEAVSFEKKSEFFKRYGKFWASSKIRFFKISENKTGAYLGEIKTNYFEFILTKEGWKLDLWRPGQY